MTQRPAGWKNYDDFAAGIATNRLPPTDVLVGRQLDLRFDGSGLALDFTGPRSMRWTACGGAHAGEGHGACEVIEVAADTHFIDLTFSDRPLQALTLIVNHRSRRALAVRCVVRSVEEAGGDPRVVQDFLVGTLGDPVQATGPVPHETRDLIGLRTWQTYSPQHTYEHTYLSSQRYAWQCLVGVQRGQGDVDLASYYKFDDGLYVFTFREFLIPVASVFLFNFHDLRSTGKFLGITGAGEVQNNPAGAFIRKASMTFYPDDTQPV